MIDAYSGRETYQKVAFDYEEILKWRWKPEDEGILTFFGDTQVAKKKMGLHSSPTKNGEFTSEWLTGSPVSHWDFTIPRGW